MYRAYERVRASSRFNMYDPRAQQAAGLRQDEYVFVMSNYEALKAAHDALPPSNK
jgi:hypothetical protein